MSEKNNQPGLIDAADRVAQELLDTPGFKEAVKIVINSLDPESAPALVRTLMWRDADMFLAVLGAAPDLVNALLLGGKELLGQMEKMPPPLIAQLVAKVIDKLDGEAVGSIMNSGAGLYLRTKDVPGEAVKNSADGFKEQVRQGLEREDQSSAAVLLSILQPLLQEHIRKLSEEAGKEGSETNKLIRGLSETLTESIKENPDFITHVYKPLSESFRRAAGESD